jgi:hypothetical protein
LEHTGTRAVHKTCNTCGHQGPVDEFVKNGRYHLNKCKPCNNKERNKLFVERYRHKYAEWNRRALYNITQQEYEQLCLDHPVCAICKTDIQLVIDHCHDTGKIRGRLCSSCNKGLGFFKDNTELMERGIEYLDTSCFRH